MKYHQYRYKFYLNANHSIFIHGSLGEKHPHTWEIVIDTVKVVEGFVQFNGVEKRIEQFLATYQDQYLNDIEPFNTTNPTLENLSYFFRDEMQKLLDEMGWVLLSIEISETPSRSFKIDLTDEVQIKDDKGSETLMKPTTDTASPTNMEGMAESLLNEIIGKKKK